MPTIKDIARAAGVSHGTVSNVLNKRGGVSYEKIRLVEQTARAMGYAIDEKASLLRRGTTRILAVILPTLGEKHYVDLYTGILACADEKRYSVRLFLTGDMPYRERHVIEEALALKACGVLSVSCLQNHKKEYQAFAARKIPLLFLERPSNHAAFPTYSFHMSEAAEQIAAYVKARNTCARICVLTDSSQFGNQQEFLSVLRNRLDVADGNVYENVRGEQSVAAHEALLHNCEHACIAICTSEALADRLRNIFANAGKPVPEIYTLVSLQPCRDIFYYTVGLNYQLMGRNAAEAILTQAESGTPAESRRYRVSSCFAPPPAPALPQRRPLRMLAHDTPSTTALRYLLPRFTSRFGVPVELHVGSMEEILNILLSPQAVDWDVVRVDPSNLTHLAPRLFLPLNRVDSSVASQFNRFLPGLQSEFYNVGGEIYSLRCSCCSIKNPSLKTSARSVPFLSRRESRWRFPTITATLTASAAFFPVGTERTRPSATVPVSRRCGPPPSQRTICRGCSPPTGFHTVPAAAWICAQKLQNRRYGNISTMPLARAHVPFAAGARSHRTLSMGSRPWQCCLPTMHPILYVRTAPTLA